MFLDLSVVHIWRELISDYKLNPHKNVSWQVLSELLADLDACDSQKGDTKVLANGEVTPGLSNSVTHLVK